MPSQERPRTQLDQQPSQLVKATLTHLETLETMQALWNPNAYQLERRNRFSTAGGLGVQSIAHYTSGSEERFATRLLLDSTREIVAEAEGPHPTRPDLLEDIQRLERWALPGGNDWLPPRLVFAWGSFRFRGSIETLRQDWIRFDATGRPLRGWIDLVLRRTSR